MGRLHSRRPAPGGPRRDRVGAGGRRARRGRDPPDEHGSRRDQGRIRPRAHTRGLADRVRARHRLGRRRLARASLRGPRRGLPRGGARRLDLPLRDSYHRRSEGLSAGGGCRGAGRAVTLDELRFDSEGLIPAVVQEADTGELLMVAWMDRAAVEKTLSSGVTHFWSRSRGKSWRKGETSGHVQHVQSVFADCDGDTLLVQVHQEGVACHTGQRTCFFTALKGSSVDPRPAPSGMLERLERTIEERKASRPAGSYVAGLLAAGEPEVCRKIGEEATEVITAALGGQGDRRVTEEGARPGVPTPRLPRARGSPPPQGLEEPARRHAGRTPPGRERPRAPGARGAP